MFRAQAVLLASACLAFAPAAFAETHHASHKAHARGHAEETHSKRAKLRREADEAPAEGRRAHAEKASSHRRHADEEADAAPSRSSRHHSRTTRADEEADARASRSSRHHGKKTRAEEEADAAPSRSSRRRHEEARAEDDQSDRADSKARRRHRAGADETDQEPRSRIERARAEEHEGSSLIRSELRSTRACVAAHTRLHGRPHSRRARLALQRECAKEVEAARRRAEEEIAIRTWAPPHGPLIYRGALPHGPGLPAQPAPEPTPAAAPLSDLPTEPGPVAPAGSAGQTATAGQAAQTDPTVQAAPLGPIGQAAQAAPIGQAARTDASTPPATSPPAPGAATVVQAPPPSSGGLFGLFRRRAAATPERKPGDPAPTLAELVGSDEVRLKAELGQPELMHAEGDGALWTYRLPACALYVFLGRETTASPWKVKGAQAGPLRRGDQAPDVDVCLKSRS